MKDITTKVKVENLKVRIKEEHYKKLKELSKETEYPIVFLVQMALDDYLSKIALPLEIKAITGKSSSNTPRKPRKCL